MEYAKGLLAIASAIIALPGPGRAETIQFYTFPSPPYQVVSEMPGPATEVRGLTADTVLCATTAVGRQSRVLAAPPKRGAWLLANDLTDGYFAVDPSMSLDGIALRTNPVSLEKWHMVSRAGSRPPEKPRIGAVSGSNEEAWLRSQGEEIYMSVQTAEQLIALLHRGRIDQALMDQRVLASLGDTESLSSQFLRYVPLYVYFSSAFVSRNPDFIDAFNQQIPGCVSESFDLDEAARARIHAMAQVLFRSLEAHLSLKAAIAAGPDITSLSEILNLDAQWQALAPRYHSKMARLIASKEASLVMNNWRRNHGSLVTEVMLTNSIGALMAMSDLTSDFWQGDEPEFERHIRKDARSLYVSPIQYDASTSRFQVKVSKPVVVAGRWLPIGVLIIAIDVEKALAAH